LTIDRARLVDIFSRELAATKDLGLALRAVAVDAIARAVVDVDDATPVPPIRPKPARASVAIESLTAPPDEVDEDAILGAVARRFDSTVAQMLRPGRKAEAVAARRVAMLILRRRGLPFAAIGRLMKQDHTTAVEGITRALESPDLIAAAEAVVASFFGAPSEPGHEPTRLEVGAAVVVGKGTDSSSQEAA
jgi:hypothetical protein